MKKNSLTKLTIANAQYYAYHGVKPEERNIGGKYEVDLDLYYDAKMAVLKDSVEDALNYEEALFCISEVVGNESYMLVETVASEILNMLMEKFPQLQIATVRIRKMNVPMKRVVGHIQAEQTIERKPKD